MTPGTPSEKAQPEPEGGAGPAGTQSPTPRASAPKAAPSPAPAPVIATNPGFVTASHELLFRPPVPTCDACDGPLAAAGDDEEDLGGHGLYIWVRHGTVVYEEPPLCAACASAITISALQRWDIEEEEG